MLLFLPVEWGGGISCLLQVGNISGEDLQRHSNAQVRYYYKRFMYKLMSVCTGGMCAPILLMIMIV